jgi:large subunit ribosomal protein L10
MASDTGTIEHKRATVRPDKGEAVAELVAHFSDSAAAVLTEYRGLTVKQISELRRALGADTTYAVVKNTLSKIAASQAGLTGADELLSGPTAVAFIGGDPVTAAKSLRDFAKANPALIVKGGFMDGKALSPNEVKKLADLESREVLLAKLAGAMKASLTQAVYLFAAPLSQAARAIGALEAQVAANGPTAAPEAAAEAPVAEAPAAEAAEEAPAAEAATEAPAAEAAPDAPVAAVEAPEAEAPVAEAPEAPVATEAPEATETAEAPAAEASTDAPTSETE